MAQPGRWELFGTAATGMAAAALAVNLLLVFGLIALIAARGLGYFWPSPLVELALDDGSRVLGEIWERQPLPSGAGTRVRVKTATRDVGGADFAWID
jgi:phosphate transport system permease protein